MTDMNITNEFEYNQCLNINKSWENTENEEMWY